jgi:hypothetical protein
MHYGLSSVTAVASDRFCGSAISVRSPGRTHKVTSGAERYESVDDGSTLGYDSTEVSATATRRRRGSPFGLECSTQREIEIDAVGDEFVFNGGARHLGR